MHLFGNRSRRRIRKVAWEKDLTGLQQCGSSVHGLSRLCTEKIHFNRSRPTEHPACTRGTKPWPQNGQAGRKVTQATRNAVEALSYCVGIAPLPHGGERPAAWSGGSQPWCGSLMSAMAMAHGGAKCPLEACHTIFIWHVSCVIHHSVRVPPVRERTHELTLECFCACIRSGSVPYRGPATPT